MVENKSLNYNRDDVYIISLNKTSDMIEETKIGCYNQTIKVYEYFARVEACYDKSWRYISNHEDIEKELEKFKKKLYDKKLLKDIKDETNLPTIEKYLAEVLGDLTKLYRKMTGDYVQTGLFPKFYVETDEVGAVREARHN